MTFCELHFRARAGLPRVAAGRGRVAGPLLAVAAACLLASQAVAQTPSLNLMPDGSHDMYLGLGLISHPLYEGARDSITRTLPVLQAQWSNGIFVAGSSLGWHASSQPQHEYGPLLMFESKRTAHGKVFFADASSGGDLFPPNGSTTVPATTTTPHFDSRTRLAGVPEVPARVLGGAFYNLNLDSHWRFSNSVLYGAGESRNGLRLEPQIRYTVSQPHYTLSLGAGLVWGNQAYNQTYFGVPKVLGTVVPAYVAGRGVNQVYLDLRSNLALTSSLLLVTSLKLAGLQGSAADSTLVERRVGLSATSALAWRF
jgi:outer membrane scaffolding protein for murein synthesis (MipA/OmpV family)